MITGHGLLNTRVVPFLVTEAPPTEAPPPRRLRGFPLPLWRGVNGLANDGLITTLQTIVGRWFALSFLNYELYKAKPIMNYLITSNVLPSAASTVFGKMARASFSNSSSSS